jgi:hypothetical protein
MDLANMREQGVQHLIAFCLNDTCQAAGIDRRVELRRCHRSPLLLAPDQMQQVRAARPGGRAAELERAGPDARPLRRALGLGK